MKLSRKKAIELCIDLWSWLAETGKEKGNWTRWKEFEDVLHNCWFCEYDAKQRERYRGNHLDGCPYCPYYKMFGHCEDDTPYDEWYWAPDIEEKKKYAKLFLKQIKSIK